MQNTKFKLPLHAYKQQILKHYDFLYPTNLNICKHNNFNIYKHNNLYIQTQQLAYIQTLEFEYTETQVYRNSVSMFIHTQKHIHNNIKIINKRLVNDLDIPPFS